MRFDSHLPQDEVRFLEALPIPEMHSRLAALHHNGWSFAALGRSLNPEKAKTTVHYWVRNAPTPTPQRRAIPQAPNHSLFHAVPTLRTPQARSIAPKVPPDLRPHLRELAQLSRRYRARTPGNSVTAQANQELTRLAVQLHSYGVPTSDIAAAAGITYRAVARRISLHAKKDK
jgi:hypothetical protein